MTKENVQFVYTNSLAWYGARLALDLLKNYAVDYNIIGCNIPKVTNATNQKALLVSILADRSFFRLFKIFDHAKLPYLSSERNDSHPLVIVGGSAMYQPEPIADMVDVICVGDGEEFLMGLNEALNQKTKNARLDALAELPGAYVPGRRSIVYDKTGFFVKDVVGDDSIVIPHISNIWSPPPDDKSLEIARGCNKKCAFCAITWRQQFRERPKEETNKYIGRLQASVDFYAPNTGGVSYYHDIMQYKKRGTPGDITVDDFLGFPEPTFEEYKGIVHTFGIEGITPKLRRLTGKPISYEMMDEFLHKLARGGANLLQLYFIRNIPGETKEDWDEFVQYFYSSLKPFCLEHGIHAEAQFTPLTKQAHTPLQWFSHNYNNYAENLVKKMMVDEKAYYNEQKRLGIKKPPSVFITPSRRKSSWMIDIMTNCASRHGLKFLYAQHTGKLSRLASDKYVGSGYNKVINVIKQCGMNPDVILGDWDLDDPLPWSHIQPMGAEGERKRRNFAKSIRRRINR